MIETPKSNTTEDQDEPTRVGDILIDIDGVLTAGDPADERKTAVTARDLDDESSALRDNLEVLHQQDPDSVDRKAVEAAKEALLQVDVERISRGGNPPAR